MQYSLNPSLATEPAKLLCSHRRYFYRTVVDPGRAWRLCPGTCVVSPRKAGGGWMDGGDGFARNTKQKRCPLALIIAGDVDRPSCQPAPITSTFSVPLALPVPMEACRPRFARGRGAGGGHRVTDRHFVGTLHARVFWEKGRCLRVARTSGSAWWICWVVGGPVVAYRHSSLTTGPFGSPERGVFALDPRYNYTDWNLEGGGRH